MKKFFFLMFFVLTFAPVAFAVSENGSEGKDPGQGADPLLLPTADTNANMIKNVPDPAVNSELLALAQDPEIMNAANSMDIEALMTNEKFVKFINDSPASQTPLKSTKPKK